MERYEVSGSAEEVLTEGGSGMKSEVGSGSFLEDEVKRSRGTTLDENARDSIYLTP